MSIYEVKLTHECHQYVKYVCEIIRKINHLPASDTFSGFFVMAAVEELGGRVFIVVDLVVVVAKMLNKMFRRESTECYLSKTVELQSKILIFLSLIHI